MAFSPSPAHLILRFSLFLALLLAGTLGVKAADYVLAYVNGGTTYYVARNGTTGVQRVTTFDPTTCIWSCSSNTAGTTAGTLNNSNTYGYLFQTVNGTRYFLGAPDTDLALATSVASNYYRWRTNGTYVYNRYSGTYSYYINLANGVARNTTANTASNARPYQVTISDVAPIAGALTINEPANVLNHTGTYTFTHNTPTYRMGYINYSFNSTNHYFDTDGNSITPANATVGDYTWFISENPYATISSGGVVNVASLPEVDTNVTVTLTANVTGGTPAFPVGTMLTASTEVTILGTLPIAPDITVSGSTATITTDAAGTTSIRYTLDGSDPTATTGTVYSGAIDLSTSGNSPVTIKAITVRDGNVSNVTTQVVTLTLPAPTITADGAAGTATISSSVAGATIYYTTDGSTPTTSSSVYSGVLSGLSAMTTIKAIAVKSGWNTSAVASGQMTIPSGVSGGVVTLFDYEDHNWTYYKGVDASVDGGNYNTKYAGTLYSPNPRNVKITYKANGGAVSIDETETEFVYYKTLEQGTTAGQYPYTVISNPFSKRPNGKGFGGWKIKEGADYINGYADEDILPLDADIVFTNLPYPSVNCTSAEIELEATWVNYNNLTYASGNRITYSVTGGTYETNFLVLNRNVTGTITVSSPCTIMMVEPDGSTDYRGTYTFTGAITPGANIVTKIEFAHWQPGAAVDARGRNFTIGRGMTMDGTRRALYGTNQTSAMNQILKVESGNFTTFTSYNNTPSSITRHWVVFGCDYDRAKGDNAKLTFSGRFLTADNKDLGLTSTGEMARVWSKSGSFMTGVAVADAAANNSYYIGVTSTHNYGHRYLEIQGGEWYANIAGGMGEGHTATAPGFTFRMKGGIIRGSVYGAAAFVGAGGTRTYVITGGSIGGWVAGGANGTQSNGGLLSGATYIYVGGKARIDSNGSTSVINRAVGGNVFGAGCGYSGTSDSGEISLGTNVVVADEAYIERGVYGGGSYGFTEATSNLYVTGGTVDGKNGGVNGTTYQASITGGVFGGACQNRGGTVNITMTGGQVNGGMYGGSNVTGTIAGSVTINVNGGQVGTTGTTANIHGGGFGQPTRVNGNVEITLGTTTQTTPGVTVYGDVYGGSALGTVNDAATDHTYVTMNKGVINGSLYGGGLGNAAYAANVYGPVAVKVYGGSVNTTSASGSGAVYGCNNLNGAPQRAVTVDIYGTDPAPSADTYALDAVYGGGNQADYSYGTPTVKVHNCDNSIAYVYGGGNAAHITNGNTDVTIYGGDKIGNVFGGGNGQVEPANISGNTNVKIYGGTIGKVFGGSNTQGTIGGTINVTVVKQAGDSDPDGSSTACAMHIDEVYGGGNMAASNAGNISIGCTGAEGEGIGDVYGGANAANITGDIALNITGGSIERVFGGNNISGDIQGSIQVNVEETGCHPITIGELYGCGNQAAYTTREGKDDPVINVKSFTSIGRIFGGGLGEGAIVKGNPTVNINEVTGLRSTYSPWAYPGTTITYADGSSVTLPTHESGKIGAIGTVFGGGNAAKVEGNTSVNVGTEENVVFLTPETATDAERTKAVEGVNIQGNVFGGGNNAEVTGKSNVVVGKK